MNIYNWTWITTGRQPCPDCGPRHGIEYPLSIWESIGLPGEGTTICGGNCMCLLLRNRLILRMSGLPNTSRISDALDVLGVPVPTLVMSALEQDLMVSIGLPLLADMDIEAARIALIEEIRAIELIDFLEVCGVYELAEIYGGLVVP